MESHERTDLEKGLSRRTFIKGGLAAGVAAVGSGALMGCSSAAGSSESGKDVPDLPNAAPIPPVEPPTKWDGEADIVVVGTGGGGLAASVFARDQGASVITIEKNGWWGGATVHACGYVVQGGGSRAQDKIKFALPSWPFDPDAFIRLIAPNYQLAVDFDLLRTMAIKGGECADWMEDHGVDWVASKHRFYARDVVEKKQNNVLGMKTIVDHMYKKAVDAGAKFFFETACTALVKDGDRIVGVKAETADGKTVYYRGKKAVILCAGGFGMNRDMLKKYCPTAYEGVVSGGPMPWHTGECTRMALGVGADISGFDSWGCWDGGLEMPTEPESGWWQYLWSGADQLTRNPWLHIDIMGNRYPIFDLLSKEACPAFMGGVVGGQGGVQMSRMNHRGYCIFDADYETKVWKLEPGADRIPIRPEDPMVANDMAPRDWRDGVKKALDQGQIKKSDTIEGLAKELEMDPQVLRKAVDDWNKCCAEGKDTVLKVYPYDPKWLIPIEKAPYYGARIGGQLGKTLAGVRVNSKLQVIGTDAKAIPGLYANFTTAGGMCGESSFGGALINTSILGGNALSWTSGYRAAQAVFEE